MKKINKKCDGCGEIKEDVSEKIVKENGVVAYYEVKKNYCSECEERHNRNLLENWG